MSRPAFLSKKSLAFELDVSESTVDEMVRRGVLPKPLRLSTGCIRWSWEAVTASLASLSPDSDTGASDPFLAGAQNATKATRTGHV
jgi:predicted DNA-binding transcriptional regulator AlpA